MTNLMKFNPLHKMYLTNLSWIWYYIFAINHKQIERLDVYSHPIERSFDTVSVRDCPLGCLYLQMCLSILIFSFTRRVCLIHGISYDRDQIYKLQLIRSISVIIPVINCLFWYFLDSWNGNKNDSFLVIFPSSIL
jgi:hypothetical protein